MCAKSQTKNQTSGLGAAVLFCTECEHPINIFAVSSVSSDLGFLKQFGYVFVPGYPSKHFA